MSSDLVDLSDRIGPLRANTPAEIAAAHAAVDLVARDADEAAMLRAMLGLDA